MKFFRNLALAASLLCSALFAQAGALTDTLEASLINHLFRGTAYTAPTTWYVGLLTGACSDSAAGTEVTGGSYARAAVAAGAANWAAVVSGNGTTNNVNAVAFATPTAGWGNVVSFGLYDAASAGNLLICSPLTIAKTINQADTVTFPAASLTVQIDN